MRAARKKAFHLERGDPVKKRRLTLKPLKRKAGDLVSTDGMASVGDELRKVDCVLSMLPA